MSVSVAPNAAPEIERDRKMQFMITGFSEIEGARQFAFDGIAEDKRRRPFTVTADLALARRYGIRLQELPLLCRAVLEQYYDGGEHRSFAFTEDKMRLYALAAAERQQAAKNRKPPRRSQAAASQETTAYE